MMPASDIEKLFLELSDYFKDTADELSNMDAKGISKHLHQAYTLIKKRSGN